MKKLILSVVLNPLGIYVAAALEKLSYYYDRYIYLARKKRLFPSHPDLVFSNTTQFKYLENLILGNRVIIGPHVSIGAYANITLEDDVRISQGVIIETAGLDLSAPVPYPHIGKSIVIKRGAWIGSRAIVLGGVTIGEGAVIGAGVVVTKDVAANAIVVGTAPRILNKKL
ncbi:MAG: acyltransferase [Nevskiaceae bacterium]|nr:MAG: acyltransferase [Nevskiaceae bacterium]